MFLRNTLLHKTSVLAWYTKEAERETGFNRDNQAIIGLDLILELTIIEQRRFVAHQENNEGYKPIKWGNNMNGRKKR